MQSSHKKAATFIMCTLFAAFSGCSLWQPGVKDDISIIKNQPLLSNYWTLHSKVGIKSPKNNGSAQLIWNQVGSRYNVTLTGPLGRSLGSLKSNGKKVTLKSKSGDTRIADSEEQLALDLIGQPLPIAQMQFWIKGLKAPFYPIEPVSATPESLEFIQKGWLVKMKGFEIVEGYKLPKRLILTYPGTHSKTADNPPVKSQSLHNIELTIIMKKWKLPAETAYESL